MNASSSLRRRLLATVIGLVSPLAIGLAFALFAAVNHAVWERFDAELGAFAHTLADLAEVEGDELDFELGEHPAPLGQEPGGSTHFWIWDSDGELAVSTEGLEAAEVPRPTLTGPDEQVTEAVVSGMPMRMHAFRFVPAVDEEFPAEGVPGEIVLVVGKETRSTFETLRRIGTWFFGLGSMTLIAASIAAWWAVRRGLEPVDTLVASIRRIDADKLDQRLDAGPVPAELRPIVTHSNALLDRLEVAFENERAFTADVAHELRTPLAVLRAELELGSRAHRTPTEQRTALANALQTVDEMTSLVDRLLSLVRLESGGRSLPRVRLRLHALVVRTLATHEARAASRGLRVDNALSPDEEIECEEETMKLVIGNLLANAVEYTEQGGWIRIDRPQGSVVRVIDSGPLPSEADRARMFQRFWRGDRVRSDVTVHAGIGLSLVRALCAAHGWQVRAEDHDGALAFVIRDDY